jgi:hypothetical protein
VQDAFIAAVQQWSCAGLVLEPGAMDHRSQRGDRPPPRGAAREGRHAQARATAHPRRISRGYAVRDDRLRLIFTCCHFCVNRRRSGRIDAPPLWSADHHGDRGPWYPSRPCPFGLRRTKSPHRSSAIPSGSLKAPPPRFCDGQK